MVIDHRIDPSSHSGIKNYRITVHSTINEISRLDWFTIWPSHLEGYDFYLSQEKSNLVGFQFKYITIYDGDTLVLVAPLFISDFDMSLALGKKRRKILSLFQQIWPHFLVFKTLFCGAITSEKGFVGLHTSYKNDGSIFTLFDEVLVSLAKGERATMIVFKDFMDADLTVLTPLKTRGWFMGNSLPTVLLDICFSNRDEYLDSLSHGMRKNLKRKLRENKNLGEIEIEVVQDVSHCIQDVHKLYLAVRSKGELPWETLTTTYFQNFTELMPHNTLFFLYWLKDSSNLHKRLVAFNFCFQFEDRLIDKYIGLDYSVSRDLNLYYISFLNNVQWCIENKKSKYILSQGGYSVKAQLGARQIPLLTMTKMVNPVLNLFANFFS